MSNHALLEQQLFRYAQDLQELMEQQSKLQQRYQMVLQSLGIGSASEDLLAGLLIQTLDTYLVTDQRGEITYVSPAADRTLSTSGQALKGQMITQWMPPDQWPSVDQLLDKLTRDSSLGPIQQQRLVLGDARDAAGWRCYQALVMPVNQLDRLEIYWLLDHALDPQAGEQAFDIQKSFPFFTSSEGGLMITDATGRICAINPAFSRITGYSASEVMGENARVLSSKLQGADFYQVFWHSLLEAGTWTGEIFNRRKNGQLYFERTTVTAIKNARDETMYYIAAFEDMSPHSSKTKQLTLLAYHDTLTGLPNRRLLEDRMAQAIAVARREQTSLCVLFLDLNRFKPINDEYGHDVGDLVLKEVGLRLQATVRKGDTVARVGGDEFVVLLKNVGHRADAERIINAIQFTLAAPIALGFADLVVGASIGCVSFPQDGDDMATLLKLADSAMYGAKRFGMPFCFYEQGDNAVLR